MPIPSRINYIRSKKKHAVAMNKWAERNREIRSVSESPGATEIRTITTTKSENTVPTTKCLLMGTTIVKTKRGQLVCLLCRRKFTDKRKMKQHLELSELHRHNLNQKEAVAKTTSYRDRAKERRNMHGPETKFPDSEANDDDDDDAPSLTKARTVVDAEIVNPSENLGVSNIGNKMLQKLGWKEGGALGRQGGGDRRDANNSNYSDTKDKLKEDWKKIEQLAGSNGGTQGRRTGRK